MTNTNNYVAAIDIGSSEIVTTVGSFSTDGKLNILGCSKTVSSGIKRGVVLNKTHTIEEILQTVREVELQTGIKLQGVNVNINGQHINSINTIYEHNLSNGNSTTISKKDVDVFIDTAKDIPIASGKQIIHVLPQNYWVDGVEIKNPIGMNGRKLKAKMHLVIGQTAAVKNVTDCVEQAGLKFNRLVLNSLASSAAVITSKEKEEGVALFDIGKDTTNIIVYHNGFICHTSVLPFGGSLITNGLKEKFNLTYQQANVFVRNIYVHLSDLKKMEELMKSHKFRSVPADEILLPRMVRTVKSQIDDLIKKIVFGIEDKVLPTSIKAGFVLTGGGSLVQDLTKLVEHKANMEVRIGFPLQNVAISSHEYINNTMYSTVVGLLYF